MGVLGAVLGLPVGLSLGLLGGGGSVLTVPIFVYLLGFEAKQAIAASLAVVGATSLFGVVGHWRAGNVDLRIALIFGAVAMLAAYLGARLAAFVAAAEQLALFSAVTLAAAYFMFRGRPAELAEAGARHGAPAGPRPVLTALHGTAVGLLTGLVGVGGGFLIVPALVLLGNVPMRRAVGTSLVVIAMNSAAGLYGYLGLVDVPWAFTALFTAVAVLGILAGAHLSRFVPQEALKRAFAVVLVLVGVFVLYRNRAVFLSGPIAGAAPAFAAGR